MLSVSKMKVEKENVCFRINSLVILTYHNGAKIIMINYRCNNSYVFVQTFLNETAIILTFKSSILSSLEI